MTKSCLWLLVGVTIISVGTAFVVLGAVLFVFNPSRNETSNQPVINREVDNTDNTNMLENDEDEIVPDGAIVVEAGDGILEAGEWSFSSYVGESARGLEAYLASGGDKVTYTVNATTAGVYELKIKLSDDELHMDDTRSATIEVNDRDFLVYNHISEDTKGWKWYTIGKVNLLEGENKIVFTKRASTSAAFVMDEFRLEVWRE